MDGFSKHWLQQLTLLNGSKCCGTQTWFLGQECGWLPKPPAAGDEAVQSRGRWLHPRSGLTAAVVAGLEQKLSPHRAPVRSGVLQGPGSDRVPSWSGQPLPEPPPSVVAGREGRVLITQEEGRKPFRVDTGT